MGRSRICDDLLSLGLTHTRQRRTALLRSLWSDRKWQEELKTNRWKAGGGSSKFSDEFFGYKRSNARLQ